jgi:glycosyltransferase involved in cell wall biosynthesis
MLDGRAGEMKVSLIIIGSGSELARLRERCKQLDIGDRVSLIGFKNQTELAAYFELADLFIFPSSREPYGAVAAEILPFGLPIIAARDIGAVGSAIVDQRNALLYNSGDVLALKDCMTKLIDDPELRSSMASESKKVAVLQDKSVMAKDIAAYCKDKNASI